MLVLHETLGALGLGAGPSVLWGYLDPGTGSLAFQVMIAALLSGAYFLRSTLWYFRKLLARGLTKE